MRREGMILAGICGLLLPLAGCERAEKQTADERAALEEGAREAGRKTREAGEKIAGEAREGTREMGRAMEGAGEGRYERFEAVEGEDTQTFASRADAAVARIESDLKAARDKAGPRAEDMKDDFDEVQEAIDEAKKDIADVRGKTGTVIDDGRLGVSMNINEAQRKLNDLYEDLAEAKM